MNKVKKGYTLLECIVAMAMIDVIMFLCASIFYSIYKDYKYNILNERERTEVNEAFRSIEDEILYSNLKFEEHQIVIRPYNKINKVDYVEKSIFMSNNCLYISYPKPPNVLLRGVKDFSIEQQHGIEIISITSQRGIKYCKCIDTKFLK